MTRRPLLLLAAILLALLLAAFLLWLWVGLLRDLAGTSVPIGAASALPAPQSIPTAASRDFARPLLTSTATGRTTSPSASASAAVDRRSVTARSPGVVAPSTTPGPSAAQWAKLRWCESRGHYDERANPNYRGAYQIGFYEWAHYGGTGHDPADASPAEQDAVALRIWQSRGWEPWQASSSCTGLR